MRKVRVDGSVSVFLALTITMVLSLCMVLVESARENALLLKADMVFDTGMRCLMAEYHQKLWEEYDLLYIDCSYGEGVPDYSRIKTHLDRYINKNLQYDASGFLALAYEGSQITEVELASDFSGADFYLQAVQSAEASVGITYLEQVLSWLKLVEDTRYIGEQISADSAQTARAIEENNGTWVEVEEAVWGTDAKGQAVLLKEAEYEMVDIANPLDMILSGNILLRQIVGDMSAVSMNQIESSELVSQRNLAAGTTSQGPFAEEAAEMAKDSAEGLWKKALFCKYALDHFGSLVDDLQQDAERESEGSDEAVLKYSLEYLVGGRTSDAMNLEIVAAELLAIREVDNYLLLLQDEVKRAEADAIGAAAATLVPWIAPLVSQGVLIYWAYEESVADLQKLFRGEEIPLVKAIKADVVSEFTLGYEDYLFILLLMQGRNNLILRAMDMIESDIRTEQPDFRIDACIGQAILFGSFRDIYDKKYTIENKVQYYEEAS